MQRTSSPLTRSSYHAGEDFAQMKAARALRLAQSERAKLAKQQA